MAEALSPLIINRKMMRPVVNVFSEAFHDDPLFSWLMPDASTRRSLLPLFFNFRVRHGLYYGEVHATSTEVEGAAIWIPHTQTDMTRWKMIRSGGLSFIRNAEQVTLQRFQTFGTYADELHHQYASFPHQSLFLIGVHPQKQGQGYANVLMKSMLERLDREKLPCFLETQTPINVDIYQKYDFTIKHQGKIPGTEIPHWAMLREPRE
jgi:GNAT superfamily N-acetyltransferase